MCRNPDFLKRKGKSGKEKGEEKDSRIRRLRGQKATKNVEKCAG